MAGWFSQWGFGTRICVVHGTVSWAGGDGHAATMVRREATEAAIPS